MTTVNAIKRACEDGIKELRTSVVLMTADDYEATKALAAMLASPTAMTTLANWLHARPEPSKGSLYYGDAVTRCRNAGLDTEVLSQLGKIKGFVMLNRDQGVAAELWANERGLYAVEAVEAAIEKVKANG